MLWQVLATFVKFRCGVAPLKIETGRYERKELNERLCINCDNLEDEKHVLLKCPLCHFLF
jgi:ssDNA-binding Zn-finger/Zn-ribbon topoisomerase 1